MSIFPSANGNVNLSEMFLDDFLRTAGAFELHQFREMPAVKQRRICRIFAPAESSNPKSVTMASLMLRAICIKRCVAGRRDGARYWVRTSDPYRVKVVLYH
jgi:hypothetical protein